MKERKLLITGGNGKTGHRVVKRLTQAGYKDILVGSRRENPPFDWENLKHGLMYL